MIFDLWCLLPHFEVEKNYKSLTLPPWEAGLWYKIESSLYIV